MRTYIVRNEGIKPIYDTLGCIVTKSTMYEAQKKFKDDFSVLIKRYLPEDVEVKFDSLNNQVSELVKALPLDTEIISLDSMYTGDYNIRMSRLYSVNSNQKEFIGLVSSHDTLSIEEQIDLIPSGHYVLVDDDSVARDTILEIISNLKDGQILQSEIVKNKYCKTNSMMHLISMLRDDIIIDDIQLLSRFTYSTNVYDTVDLRDFIFGVSNSGLKVKFDDGAIIRVPYIEPFTSLSTRAKIKESDVKNLSQEICELNYKFFCSLGNSIRLADMSKDFKDLMHRFNISDSEYMIDVCSFIKSLI